MSIMVMCILTLVYTANHNLPRALTISRAPVFAPFFKVSLDISLVSGSRKKKHQKVWEEQEGPTFEAARTQYNDSQRE